FTARIVAKLRLENSREMLGRMLILHGWFIELNAQDYERATAILEEGSQIGLKLGYKNCAEGLLRLSDVAVQVGDYERGRQLAQQCVDFDKTGEEFWTHTFDLAQLGWIMCLLGNYSEAKDLIQDAIHIAEKYDVPSGLSDARNFLGQI